MTELELREKVEALTPQGDPAEAINLLGLIAEAEKRLDELKRQVRDAIISMLRERGGAVTIGPSRYYLGVKKPIKPVSLRAVTEAVLTASSGDIDGFVECLSASAFKPGKCREVLGEATWDAVFNVEEETEIREGKPERVITLLRADTQFLIK